MVKQAILSAFSNVVVCRLCRRSTSVCALLCARAGTIFLLYFYLTRPTRLGISFMFASVEGTAFPETWFDVRTAHVTIYSNSIPCHSREVFYYLINSKKRKKKQKIQRTGRWNGRVAAGEGRVSLSFLAHETSWRQVQSTCIQCVLCTLLDSLWICRCVSKQSR